MKGRKRLNTGILKKRVYMLLLAGIAIFFVLKKKEEIASVVSVLFCSCIWLLLLLPMSRYWENKGVPVSLAALLSIVFMICTISLIFAFFIPYLTKHSLELIRRSLPTLSGLIDYGISMLKQLGINREAMQGFSGLVGNVVTEITGMFARSGVWLAAQAGKLVLSLVIAYYALCERNTLGSHFLLCIPLRFRAVFLKSIWGCRNAVLGYLSGLIKTSLFVGIATYLGLRIIGIPDALLLSLFMGVFEILPYLGPVFAAIPILLSAIPLGFHALWMSLAIVILVQQIEGNVISPLFTASSTSIHPFAALIGVFISGSLFGVWGILLAVPVIVITRSAIWSIRQTASA